MVRVLVVEALLAPSVGCRPPVAVSDAQELRAGARSHRVQDQGKGGNRSEGRDRNKHRGRDRRDPDGFHARIEDRNARALWPFFRALRATQQGKRSTRIVYLGDSHVTSDRLTGQLRRRLQGRFGDGGLGFLLPARASRHYRHAGVELQRPRGWQVLSRRRASTPPPLGFSGYGLMGRSRRARTLHLTFRPRLSHPSRLEVYVYRRPNGGKLLVRAPKVREVLSARGKPQLVAHSVRLGRGVGRVSLRPVDGEVLLVGVAQDNRQPGVTLDVAGVNGARARDLLKADRAALLQHLRLRNPQLLVLGFGTNEAMNARTSTDDFKRELRRVLRPLRRATKGAACLQVGPTDHPRKVGQRYRERPATRRVIQAYREVAFECGCAFIDLVRTTGGPGSMLELARRRPRLGAPDLTHLTIRGYREVGDALADALLERFDAFEARTR